MLDGFKKFIMRGNVIDLAVGVIIGNAFKPIIDALTDKILLRLISAIFGKPSFNEVGTFHIGTTARGVSASRASASHVGRGADSRPTSMSAPPGSNATLGAIR